MFGRLMNWLPIILKSVVLVEAITGLDGPSKKDKAMGLTLGFLAIMAENITDDAKEQIGGMINASVAVLNDNGIFEKSGEEEARQEEAEEERREAVEKAKLEIEEAEELALEEAEAEEERKEEAEEERLAEEEAKNKVLIEEEARALIEEEKKVKATEKKATKKKG